MGSSYYIIYEFMSDSNKLNLSGNPLNVYALIYSFTKQNKPFTGNASYVAIRCNINRSSAQTILNKLLKKGYLYRTLVYEQGAVKVYNYYATIFECDDIFFKRTNNVSSNPTGNVSGTPTGNVSDNPTGNVSDNPTPISTNNKFKNYKERAFNPEYEKLFITK